MTDRRTLVANAEQAIADAIAEVGKLVLRLEEEEHNELDTTRYVEGTLYAASNLFGDLASMIMEGDEEEED